MLFVPDIHLTILQTLNSTATIVTHFEENCLTFSATMYDDAAFRIRYLVMHRIYEKYKAMHQKALCAVTTRKSMTTDESLFNHKGIVPV